MMSKVSAEPAKDPDTEVAAPRSGLVIGFGEAMLRLAPDRGERLQQATELSVTVGGAELNVLISLAQLGRSTRWVTALAEDELSSRILSHARSFEVSVKARRDAQARCPLYFVEHGVGQRAGRVRYDRRGSALARVAADGFDWSELLTDGQHFHVTGITSGLGPGAATAAERAMSTARSLGLTTSFDLNYRSTLWSWPEAHAAARRMLPRTDVLFASPHDLILLEPDGRGGAAGVARLQQEFGIGTVLVRETFSGGDGTAGVLSTAYTAGGSIAGEQYDALLLDPIGAGDAATAAFLTVWLRSGELDEAVAAASWACASKYTMTGDTWVITPAEFAARHTDSRMQR